MGLGSKIAREIAAAEDSDRTGREIRARIPFDRDLWRAMVDPSRAAGSLTVGEITRLHREIVDVLRESIAARGTSFRDYRDARGERGRFAEELKAYGRAGEPCARCGRKLIGTHAIDGRATVLCASCQS